MLIRIWFIAVAFAAIAPLSTVAIGLLWVTPYVILFPLFFLSIMLWIHRPVKVIRRREEYAFTVSQLLTLVLVMQGIDPSESIQNGLLPVYAIALYWTTRFFLKTNMVGGSDFLFIAISISLILVIVGTLQYITKSNVAVIPAYFGGNLTQGVGENLAGGVRVSGTFANSNVFAHVLIIYSSGTLGYLLFFGSRYAVMWASVFALVSLFVITSSLSRSGVLGAIVAYTLIYWYWFSRAVRYKSIGVIVIFVFAVCIVTGALIVGYFSYGELIPGISRLSDLDDSGTSISSRMETYSGAIEIMGNPRILFFGVGSGQFYEALEINNIDVEFKSYIAPEDKMGSVHNWPLLMITEYGGLVFVLYLFAIYKTVKNAFVKGKTVGPPNNLVAIAGIIIAVSYVVPFSFSTSGNTPWLLTPIIMLMAFVHDEYDCKDKISSF